MLEAVSNIVIITPLESKTEGLIIHNVEERDDLKWGIVQSVGEDVKATKQGDRVLYDARQVLTKKIGDVELIITGDYSIRAVYVELPAPPVAEA